MSETRTLPLSAFTIKQAKPTEPFGQLADPPLSGTSGSVRALLLRAAIPSDVPSDALVTAAHVDVVPRETVTGATTWTLRRNTEAVKARVRWENAPTYSSTASAVLTRTGSAAGVVWPLTSSGGQSIAADVQGFIAGTLSNFGWRLTQDASTSPRLFGAVAAKNQPVLVFTYAIPGEPPTGLMPAGGAVSTGKPVMTFTTLPGTVAVQVRIDPTATIGTAWTSDEIPATAGVVDLTTTTYPGLVAGASTMWQARYQDADTGWSDWSEWVEFSRVDQPTLTLASPTATPGDGTPPFSWTFTGQTAWRARLRDAAGKVLDDSLVQSGTSTTWTPAKGLTKTGQVGTAEVSTRDAVARIATPNAPTWVTVTRQITLTPSNALAPLSNLTAVQGDASPLVTLSATRPTGVPDEVIVYRQSGEADEVRVARLAGVDVFTGNDFQWTDPTAPPNRVSVYRVVPVTNSEIGTTDVVVPATPRCDGLWLIDPDTLRCAVIYGRDDGSWTVDELAVEHQPAEGEVRRRRLFRPPPSGEQSGDIVDGPYATADEVMATLDAFAEQEPDHIYRYAAGHENIAVRLSDISHRPTPSSGMANRHAVASWSWRATRRAP